MSTKSNQRAKQAKKVAKGAHKNSASILDAAQEKLGQVGKTAAKYYRSHARSIEPERLVREKPLLTLAVSFGLGIFTGLIIALKRCSK
jgi:ElaB/YqjD/DUF883 family membrane-anchored ribosome-binding protein